LVALALDARRATFVWRRDDVTLMVTVAVQTTAIDRDLDVDARPSGMTN